MSMLIGKWMRGLTSIGVAMVIALCGACAYIALQTAMPVQAHAATAASKARANDALMTKLKALNKKSDGTGFEYFLADFDKDGEKEAFCMYRPKGRGGSGRDIKVFDYKDGKVRCVLSDVEYGVSKIMSYKKSKAIVFYKSGHGGEGYVYFKYKGGKYKLVAERCRQAIAGGSSCNGSWGYYGRRSTWEQLTKAQFNATIKGLQSGKAVKYPFSKWRSMKM